MKSSVNVTVASAVLAVLGSAPATAANHYETAFMEVEKARDFPVRGTTRAKVLKTHGEPAQKEGPVGAPPISAWKYDDFIVYFEHHRVITTVAEKDRLPSQLKGIQ